MSRTKPTEAERRMLGRYCAYCDSNAAKWCTTDGYRWAPTLHSFRFWAATRAGLLPVIKADKT